MSVYFVYRSHYGNPGCKYVRRFEADTVLGWFRSIWQPAPGGQAFAYEMELIGRNVYGLANLFKLIAEARWPPPRTISELVGRLRDALYVNEMRHGPHHVEILTDDDELEMTISVLDDHYLRKRPDRAAFLVREDWRLPDGAADGGCRPRTKTPKLKPNGGGEGATYLCFLSFFDSGNLSDLGDSEVRIIPGVWLPGLARYLIHHPGTDGEARETDVLGAAARAALAAEREQATGDEAALLAAVADPADRLAWSAYADWREEHGRPPPGVHLLQRLLERTDPGVEGRSRKPAKDEFLVQTHVAQACFHAANWGEGNGDLYHHWVLFDDRWAAADPDLAQSLLRFAWRWDVL